MPAADKRAARRGVLGLGAEWLETPMAQLLLQDPIMSGQIAAEVGLTKGEANKWRGL